MLSARSPSQEPKLVLTRTWPCYECPVFNRTASHPNPFINTIRYSSIADMTAATHFRFLDLPEELQQKVLENVDMRVPGCHIHWQPGSKLQASPMTLRKTPALKNNRLSLLLVSKAFSKMCQQLLWSQNHFFITPSMGAMAMIPSDGIKSVQPYTGTEFLAEFASGKLPLQMLPCIRSLTLYDLTNMTNLPLENARNEWFRQLVFANKVGLRLNLVHIHAPNAWEEAPDYESWEGESRMASLASLRCFVHKEIWPLEGSVPMPAMTRQLLLEMLNSRMCLRYTLRRKDQEPAAHLFLHKFGDMKDWKTFHGKMERAGDWVEDVVIKFCPWAV